MHPRYFRPAEVELLLGDPTKAKEKLGWEPTVKFADLVAMMFHTDLTDQGREAYLKQGGYEVKRQRGSCSNGTHGMPSNM